MASYELNGSNISVAIEDAMHLSVNVGESAKMEVGQAINYIQSGKAELQPLVNASAQSANNAETSAQNASDSATAALGYAERAETAAQTAENMADKDLSNLSETGEARFAEKADDDAVVHLAGNETITGTKTLDGVLRVTDDQKLIGLSGSLVWVKNGTTSSWLTEGHLEFYDDGVVTELSKTSFKLNNSEISATGIVSTAINKSNALITSGGVYTALANKQDALVSGENIKTINGQSVLGEGDLSITSMAFWGNIGGTLSDQTDLQTALNAKANTADIPTTTSDLTNDSGYITSSALAPYVLSSSLATVATSGSYTDLSDKPTIPTVDQTYSRMSTNAQSGVAVASAISTAIASVYKPAGSSAFANLPPLSASMEGYVFNITDAFTTTSDFVEGAGKEYPAGTNIVCISTRNGYKWDVLPGFIDLSGYQTTSNLVTSISSSSTDTQYPSAKCVYDIVGNIETTINTIRGVS